MKSIKFLFAALLFFATVSFTQAQSAEEMAKEWERAKAYTKEYLDVMTETGYALKPTPEMRSFAEQMLHITDANYAFAAAASGETSPVTGLEKSTTDKSKANITKLVMASYDYVIAAVKKATSTQLAEKTKLFGTYEMTKGVAFAKGFEHQTHHRGQTTVYLRLANVKPPQEKLF